MTKLCPGCQRTLPAEDFWKNQSECKDCSRNRVYVWRQENPDRLKFHQMTHYKKNRHRVRASQRNAKYSLAKDQFRTMMANQEGLCAICEESFQPDKQFAVDHSHMTGKIRQLLCSRCNTGIGQFLDDPMLVERAMHYLNANG